MQLPQIQLPEEFRGWRIFSLLLGFAFFGLSAVSTRLVNDADSLAGTMGVVVLSVGFLACGGVFVGIAAGGILSRPGTQLFGHLFYPSETITAPPKDLLFALRMRLRDRYWDAVDQQTHALLEAYGPSPELYHLRALMEGGRSGTHSAVTVEASKKLSSRAFDRYAALLRRDPPPTAIQTGIEA
jgi:hypothetical protein